VYHSILKKELVAREKELCEEREKAEYAKSECKDVGNRLV